MHEKFICVNKRRKVYSTFRKYWLFRKTGFFHVPLKKNIKGIEKKVCFIVTVPPS